MGDAYRDAIEALGWQELTMWWRWDRVRIAWEFNHADFGHIHATEPTPKSKEQEGAWRGQRWSKLFAYGDKTQIPMRILQ